MLNIPHNARKAFSRHFIKQAFVELRYAPVSLDWEEVHSKFKARCEKKTFGNVLKALATQVSMKADVGAKMTAPVVAFAHEIQGVDLVDNDQGLSVQVRRDRLIVSTSKYESFEKLWESTGDNLRLVQEIIGAAAVCWLGIRKVNVVGVGVENGVYQGEGFNEGFFTPLRQGKLDGSAIRQGETRYVLSESDVTCIIKLGFHQQATKNRFDAVFDIDVNKAFESVGEFDELTTDAKNLNEKLFDVFCWVIATDLKQSLDS